MITCESIRKRAIQTHYDLATPFYWLLWGPHIHHGLWDANEPPAVAQRQLIDRLASAAGVQPGWHVADVGCGMGGTSIALARRGCRVVGLTLSPVQQTWATVSAMVYGVGERTRFLRRDAEKANLPDGSLDLVWSVECTEHLFDKPAFFERAAGWLRPGGRVAICAWLAGDGPDVKPAVERVCEGFLCPSLGTADDYHGWMSDAGLEVTTFEDLTPRVTRTWEICKERVNTRIARLGARLLGRDMLRFVEHFDAILTAYRTGAMRYGLFVAERASSNSSR